ncbi:MAG: hypothetical protein INF79_08325 [Roseomonas sp.]|nr:hypothetical protein [Roseomonas sp.]
MEVEQYLAEVERLAAKIDQESQSFEIYVSGLKGTSAEAEACVAFRHSMSTPAELASVVGYLEFGFFADPDIDRQKAWWLFLFDITRASTNLKLERVCQRYTAEQPLFIGAPELLNSIRRSQGTGSPDFELIDDHAVECIEHSEIYRVGAGYSKLVPELHPRILRWVRDNFPTAPRFVRLDPWEFHVEQPLMRLMEAALVPANPRWLANLALFPNTRTFASYKVEDCGPQDWAQYLDYHLHNIRRLEVTAQRRKANYLTMMIEELPSDDDASGLMVGRCIHLDTRAVVGTPMLEARLQHIDLAINVYRGEDRPARMADSLQNGKVRDATYRTHLVRVEDVPFPAVFVFAEMFLKSRYLLREWFAELGVCLPVSDG